MNPFINAMAVTMVAARTGLQIAQQCTDLMHTTASDSCNLNRDHTDAKRCREAVDNVFGPVQLGLMMARVMNNKAFTPQ